MEKTKNILTENPIANFLKASIKIKAFIFVGFVLIVVMLIGLISALIRDFLGLSLFDEAINSTEKFIGLTTASSASSSNIKVGSKAEQVIAAAESMLGGTYVWGASDPANRTFDCSGLTSWVYSQVGITIPHQSGQQKDTAIHVKPVSEAVPGDILWRSRACWFIYRRWTNNRSCISISGDH